MTNDTEHAEIMNRDGGEISDYFMNVEIVPHEDASIELVRPLTLIPFSNLSALGSGFSSLADIAQSIMEALPAGEGETLYRCVFPEGVSGTLAQAKDGSGYLGTIMDHGIKAQARWIPVESTEVSLTTVPFDPMTLTIAVALANVNAKLDTIQETQKQILDYLRRDKESRQVGDLNALIDIFNRYKFNWSNETYVLPSLATVQQIHVRAEHNIEFYRRAALAAAEAKIPIHGGLQVNQKRDDVIAQLKQYQIAAYLYSFSAMMDVLLLKNFNPNYLAEVRKGIERQSLRYRELYTEVYDKVAKLSKDSVEFVAIKGISGAAKGLGRAIQNTPILGAGPVDEFLIGVGEGAGGLGEKLHRDTMKQLVPNQAAQVRPFLATIESVDRLCNQQNELLIDGDGIRISLPA